MFEGVDEVITWGPESPEERPNWDVQIEINELPYVFRTRAEDLPLATCYLTLPKSLLGTTRADVRAPGNLRVGLVWASGDWNRWRSVPTALVERLLKISGAEFWNLQGGSSRAQWKCFREGPHLHEAEECGNSIVRLAALVRQLDLVITTDTLAAHLAGALGTPAWVMLQYTADWRWQHNRNDSPWYPSLRLFRQPRAGDWESVIASVQIDLSLLAKQFARERLAA
jgi:hypothetical protein